MGIFVASKTSASVTATIQNCTLRGNRTIGIRGDAADSSTLNITINNNTIAAGTGGNNQGNQGIEVSDASNGTVTFDVENNLVGTLDGSTATPLLSTGINIFNGTSGTATMTGKVIGNTVLNDPTTASGTSNGFGIRVFNSNLAAIRAKVSNNTVKFVNTDYGILAEASGTASAPGGSQGRLDVEVSGNNVDVNDANALDAIRLQARNFSTICARVLSNTTDSGGSGFVGLFARQANSATFNIEGLASGVQAAATAQAYLAGQNPAATTVGTIAVTNFAGVAANSCSIPTLLAAGGEGPGAPAGSALTQAQLDTAATAARALWQKQGSLNADDLATLSHARFEVRDLAAGVLGQVGGATVHVDRDAAGWGWFADTTAGSDAAFAAGAVRGERRAGANSLAYSRMDLLTVVMHELGHLLGRDDLAATAHPNELMTEALPTGARRTLANSPAGSVSATIGTLPAGKHVIIVFDALIAQPLPESTSEIANQGTISGDNFTSILTDDPATAAANDATITFLGSIAYIPMALRSLPPAGLPDLIIEQLIVTRNGVQLTIRNQGEMPVSNAFWVDVYINPSTPPTRVNQIWPMLAKQGLTWGVTSGALPIAPGGTLTLSIGDAYYRPDLSAFSGTLAAGTPVYGQVDSANTLTSYGAVLENHEQAGGPYNNISGPALPQVAAAILPALLAGNSSPIDGGLPARPATTGH